MGNARVVLLAGPSGSGKSYVAHRTGLPVLCLDDFYRDGDDPDLPRVDGAVDWESPLAWNAAAIIALSAVIRGSYHLYQGIGGFVGNLIMGVIFGLIYLRWKRVGPLVVAHTLLDIAAFVGYALVAPYVNWL